MSVLIIDSSTTDSIEILDMLRDDIRFDWDRVIFSDINIYADEGTLIDYIMHKIAVHHARHCQLIIDALTLSNYEQEIIKMFDYVDSIKPDALTCYCYDGGIYRLR